MKNTSEQAMSELWKIIPSHPSHEVSNQGRVRRRHDFGAYKAGMILSPAISNCGYKRIVLIKK
jgi:hypothetical protein